MSNTDSFRLPFSLPNDCALGIAVKSYLDELVVHQDPTSQETKDTVLDTASQKWFPICVDLPADLKVAFQLWDAVCICLFCCLEVLINMICRFMLASRLRANWSRSARSGMRLMIGLLGEDRTFPYCRAWSWRKVCGLALRPSLRVSICGDGVFSCHLAAGWGCYHLKW